MANVNPTLALAAASKEASGSRPTTGDAEAETTQPTAISNTQPAVPAPPPNTYKPFLPALFENTAPPPQLITQGAEALLFKTHFLDPSTPAALKVRPSKPYRHPTLDARLTKQRVLAEARVLVKLSGLAGASGASGANEVKVPGVLSLEWDISRKVKGLDPSARGDRGDKGAGAWLMMEWIDGKSVKELLRDWDGFVKALPRGQDGLKEEDSAVVQRGEESVRRLLRRIGRAVGAMHSKGGVVHGDLTSSNIMIRPFATTTVNGNGSGADDHEKKNSATTPPSMDGEVVLIDFGLATQSVQDEDRAVDLYVLERAFGSTHPRQEGFFDAEVLQSQEGYRGSFKGANVVLKRLEEVRLRGRKRSMIG